MRADGLAGVTGHVDDLDARTQLDQLIGQDAAADSRHDHVGQQEINRVGIALADVQGLGAVFGGQNNVAAHFEEIAGQGAEGAFVLHHEHGFMPAQCGRHLGLRFLGSDGLIRPGQIDFECRADSGLAVHINVAAALLDHPIDHGEAETGALAFLFGGEEGFKDPGSSRRVHAHAGVGDAQQDIGPGFDRIGIAAHEGGIHFRVAGLDEEFASLRHGVAGVDRQVHDDLLELALIGFHCSQVRIKAAGQFHIFPDQAAQHAFHILNDSVHIQDFRFEHLLTAESQELAGERSGTASGV